MAIAQRIEMFSEFMPPGITGNLSYQAGGKPSMEGWPHETHLETVRGKGTLRNLCLSLRRKYPREGTMHDWLPHRAGAC